MARAAIRKAKIVILDEATANIDVVTEKKIQDFMREKFTESTMITVAHRLNTIIDSDMVAVFGDGELLEYGSPTDLSNSGGHFAELLRDIKKAQS